MKYVETQVKGKRKLIFFDLEGTQTSTEIIAIAAIKVTLDAKFMIKSIDEVGFKKYVIPQGEVGSYITKLTGITEDLIKQEGISFEKMMKCFKSYIGKNIDQYAFLTYGNYDKKLLFSTSVKNDNCEIEFIQKIAANYVDFSNVIAKFMKDEKNNHYSLSEAVEALGGKFNGVKHDPLYDTKNLVLLYDLFTKNKTLLKEQYKKLIFSNSKLEKPVLNVLKKLQSNQNVTPKDLEQYIDDYIR